ncbi:hypothetical protein BDN71DRAFT_1262916 [Pleurotus eryngii]|uniref:Uncharacterized protein n=1 Tax=Pleurotus eryngii TaxID=5323 RepID=A0A9P6DIX3_PLEER|nr:hypothetical protein BDN71DRAFT_1262916 [Pleurotus eryngii]
MRDHGRLLRDRGEQGLQREVLSTRRSNLRSLRLRERHFRKEWTRTGDFLYRYRRERSEPPAILEDGTISYYTASRIMSAAYIGNIWVRQHLPRSFRVPCLHDINAQRLRGRDRRVGSRRFITFTSNHIDAFLIVLLSERATEPTRLPGPQQWTGWVT